jgi:hypothetical protein
VANPGRWKDLSDYSGVPHETIREMNTCGSLDVLSRSERRLLAATLRVSLRRLERLDDGEIDLIEDKHRLESMVAFRYALTLAKVFDANLPLLHVFEEKQRRA